MKTRVTSLFGLEYPLFQGGMAWVADAALAAAVSNAGGLGVLPAMGMSPDQLREQVRKCRALTGKPFGVNIMLRSPLVEQYSQVALQEKVPVITTSAGLPKRFMPAWLNAGIKVVPVVSTVALAKHVERDGASAVIAEGCEAGGHAGEMTTFTLVPQVADAVGIPVIAAGGISDGRGIAAAILLGAQGVQCGTRFLAADECTLPACFNQEVLRAREGGTMLAGRRRGRPVRALKNSYLQELMEREMSPVITNTELEQHGSGGLWRTVKQSESGISCVVAGQAAALIKDTMPAREIISAMFTQAEGLLSTAVG